VVGAAQVDLPMTDNESLCWAALGVLPGDRRRGYGTALLQAVRDVALRSGRTSLMTELDRPAAGEDADSWPGSVFATRRGLTMRLQSLRRDLDLPVDPDRIQRLRRDALPHADGYLIECFTGPVRAEDRDRMAGLKARMSTDAPMGDLDYEPEVWDASRVLEEEARLSAIGATWWTAVAVSPDGEWAGYTQLVWSPDEPSRLHQEDTLVLREHRGRRLGLLMKLANLERATQDIPQARVVITGNAASNSPMIAVNEAMGFRVTEICEEWQAPISELHVSELA
jgi:GNAT superfamily N-acetyltransferase